MRKSATHGFTRRNVRLPDDLWTDIALIAAKTKKDLSEVVLEAVRRHTDSELPLLFGKQRAK